jgi:hypothetical protein
VKETDSPGSDSFVIDNGPAPPEHRFTATGVQPAPAASCAPMRRRVKDCGPGTGPPSTPRASDGAMRSNRVRDEVNRVVEVSAADQEGTLQLAHAGAHVEVLLQPRRGAQPEAVVDHHPPATDGRVVRVRLTERGGQAVDAALGNLLEGRALPARTPQLRELASLGCLLRTLLEPFDQEPAADQGCTGRVLDFLSGRCRSCGGTQRQGGRCVQPGCTSAWSPLRMSRPRPYSRPRS